MGGLIGSLLGGEFRRIFGVTLPLHFAPPRLVGRGPLRAVLLVVRSLCFPEPLQVGGIGRSIPFASPSLDLRSLGVLFVIAPHVFLLGVAHGSNPYQVMQVIQPNTQPIAQWS